MISEWISKDVEGSGRGVIEVFSQRFVEESKKITETSLRYLVLLPTFETGISRIQVKTIVV
jgi:hypothetical protein